MATAFVPILGTFVSPVPTERGERCVMTNEPRDMQQGHGSLSQPLRCHLHYIHAQFSHGVGGGGTAVHGGAADASAALCPLVSSSTHWEKASPLFKCHRQGSQVWVFFACPKDRCEQVYCLMETQLRSCIAWGRTSLHVY